MKTKYTALSLFTGAGGLDLGFHFEGFKIVACIEIDRIFCDTLWMNRGRYLPEDCLIINDDIGHVRPSALGIGRVDIIIGGPPCQTFSAAGRRVGGAAGRLDERGNLFKHYRRFVNHFQPEVFIFENVRGILGSSGGEDWRQIMSYFKPLHYSLSFKVLDAADYGLPQHRERLVLVGVRKRREVLFPRPSHGPDSALNLPYVTAREAIADLQSEEEPYHEYAGKYGDLLGKVPPGMNYQFFTKEMGYHKPIFAWRSRFSDFLYKADPDKPVKTIVARLGRYSGPFHWKNRRFTLEEVKRLQSFPDDYKFAGSLDQQLRQIGNSVAPTFSRALARSIRYQLFDHGRPIELIPQDYPLTFDRRKTEKAKNTRTGIIDRHKQRLDDEHLQSNSVFEEPKVSFTEYYFYSSIRQRNAVDPNDALFEGTVRFQITKHDHSVHVDVSRLARKRFRTAPLLEYVLNFSHPIGDNIKVISCRLCTDNTEDVAMAWDGIERTLRRFTGYHSLIDIYGHFTEPHPIFSLSCKVNRLRDDPIIRFAQHFSGFENTTSTLPADRLREIMGYPVTTTFADMVKHLRHLRFDVRINETNVTIPTGMFRCCYPFTMGFERQASVGWTERVNGNRQPKGRVAKKAA